MKTSILIICCILAFFIRADDDVLIKPSISFGIDISAYQVVRDWKKIKGSRKYGIKFVIIRATMGDDRKDDKFQNYFANAKRSGFVVGAYHYYDPNENSAKQASNYLKSVSLSKGDFIPIVDIENLSSIQSNKRLLIGLRNWLSIVEKRYKTKPIIYTSLYYYKDYLEEEFEGYRLWIAAYSKESRDLVLAETDMHQFTDDARVAGIRGSVDVNNIETKELHRFLLK